MLQRKRQRLYDSTRLTVLVSFCVLWAPLLGRNADSEGKVMAIGGKGFTGLLKERMSICSTLWDAGIKVYLLAMAST